MKPVSHFCPVYPGLHPVSQKPFVPLHGTSSLQCPLQLCLHSGPKVPGLHSGISNVTCLN